MTSRRDESALLECRGCNARGAITWQAADDNAPRTLMRVVGGFHLESGRTRPDRKVIVCSQCDEIHGVLPVERPAA